MIVLSDISRRKFTHEVETIENNYYVLHTPGTKETTVGKLK